MITSGRGRPDASENGRTLKDAGVREITDSMSLDHRSLVIVEGLDGDAGKSESGTQGWSHINIKRCLGRKRNHEMDNAVDVCG